METKEQIKKERIKAAKQAMAAGMVAILRAAFVLVFKTWVAMIAFNWLDLFKHPLTFVQTLVLVFVVNMLFAKADVVIKDKTKLNPNKDGTTDGTRGNDVDDK